MARLWRATSLWAAGCGVVASGQLPGDLHQLGILVGAAVLVSLGWGTVWDLAVATDWRPEVERLAGCWRATRPVRLPALPYTQPDSPAGRLGQASGRLLAWWGASFWPACGTTVLGLLAALALTTVLLIILPDRLLLLHAALAALVGLAVIWRFRQRAPLAVQGLVHVGLAWLAGHLACAPLTGASVWFSLCFALAAWGAGRIAAGPAVGRAALWLLNGGQVLGLLLLVATRQALAAGAVGLLVFGQVALQPSLAGGDRCAVAGRTHWWLMAAMAVAAVAVR